MTILAWPDFGVPTDRDAAAGAIRKAFDEAHAGRRVEVGCASGIGRTGTVLACMAILAGVQVEDSIDWVRANYRPGAVETGDQERWVHWFGAWMFEQ
jgi:protein-tyrosine phosphatase